MMNINEYRADLISYISDAHKDAYGWRPFGWELEAKNEEELEEIARNLSDAVERRIEDERREQEAALMDFEILVASNIALGARDRETAIRWIVESLDLGDYATAEYACYRLGLNYNCAGMFDGILPKEFV